MATCEMRFLIESVVGCVVQISENVHKYSRNVQCLNVKSDGRTLTVRRGLGTVIVISWKTHKVEGFNAIGGEKSQVLRLVLHFSTSSSRVPSKSQSSPSFLKS